MKTMHQALIAVDMDGTLLTPSLTVDERDAAALKEAIAADAVLLVVTGRCGEDAMVFLDRAGLSVPVLALNGALGYRMPSGLGAFRTPMARNTVAGLVALLEREGVAYTLFGEGEAAQNRPDAAADRWITHREATPTRYGAEAVRSLTDKGVYKIAYIESEATERLRRIECQAWSLPLTVTNSGADNLEFLAPGMDKGQALRRAARALDIPATRVLAIGDSANDVAMLRWAGYSAAMGNSHASVAATARRRVAPAGQGGVAEAVRWFLEAAEPNLN